MKKRVISSVLTTLYLTGCSQSASTHIDKDPYTIQTVQYSKVINFMDTKSAEIRLLCNVTYMNSVSKNPDNINQNFLVGIYTTDENEKFDFKVTLDSKLPIKVENIQQESELLKNHGVKNKWAKYFLYSFIDNEKKSLNLQLRYNNELKKVVFANNL